jgi:DNA-binding HxlR family transcriptional regulator
MVTRRPGQPRSGCAINAAVEVIGDRWSLLVLRDVMFGNRRHFPRPAGTL